MIFCNGFIPSYSVRMPKGEMKKPLLGDLKGPNQPLCDLGSRTVGILGSGDFSRSLAWRLVASGVRVVVGSRNPKRSTRLFPEEVEVTSHQEASAQAHVIFIALFPEHYSTLVSLKGVLAGKVLVDVSNSLNLNHDRPSNAELLATVFPESTVVKGFNVVSAWALLNRPHDGNKQVRAFYFCTPLSQNENQIIAFIAELE